ncbi:hypothetical protein AC1031_020625 [Aphanomyces cochlioides]|nr:hypothetical protein AC1031_020625 [Aphanomyces cochlioides]
MNDMQRPFWVPLAKEYRITGRTFAMPELGHGSNILGLETTARYGTTTEEVVLSSPTLTSRKWWARGVGKTANYCVLHARLFLHDKEHGIQAFLAPIRDTKTHESLPRVTLGDIGPKIGFQALDNG